VLPDVAPPVVPERSVELEPVDPDRPDNLWEPLPGDRGAQGIFDAEAKPRSIEFQLAKRRGILAAGAAAVAAVAAGAMRVARG